MRAREPEPAYAAMRQLRGASIGHQHSATGDMVTMTDRAWALRTIEPIGLHALIDAVAHAFGATPEDLRHWRRDEAHLVTARMVVAYLARELTAASFPTIAKAMNRDHSTIMQGRTRIIRKLDDPDPRYDAIRQVVIRLRRELSSDTAD